MADKSKIEWLDGGSTWNPIRARNRITGKLGWFCTKPSPGCKGCYAERMNVGLFGNGVRYAVDQQHLVEIFLDEKTLLAPLHWKKPRLIFPCSMTDWQADFVPDEFRDKMMAVMALTPQHTYLTLTKRAERQREYFNRSNDPKYSKIISNPCAWYVWRQATEIQPQFTGRNRPAVTFTWAEFAENDSVMPWPLPNVWLGVSAENQKYADERIPLLLQTPAAVRWVSAEPLLGPIQIRGHLGLIAAIYGTRKLDWVVAGGESGPGARPMHPDLPRSLRDQCQAAGVPFFFKQWGSFRPVGCADGRWDSGHDAPIMGVNEGKTICVYPDGSFDADGKPDCGGYYMEPVGKKAAGRLLDGKEHSEYPKVTAAAEAAACE